MTWTDEQSDIWQRIQTEITSVGRSEALQTALMVCPQLVLTESNPFRYMACHENSIHHVARSIIRYWRVRVQTFGLTRAFLPLSLDLELSALGAKEVALLETGFVCYKVNSRCGKVILHTEPVRRMEAGDNANSPEIRLRVGFYLLQIVSENVAAQVGGVLALHVARDRHFRAADAVALKATSFLPALPIKKIENHFFDWQHAMTGENDKKFLRLSCEKENNHQPSKGPTLILLVSRLRR